jgi:tripartite-type tricarboxylate transporter receptor subunit TctC
VTASRPPLIIAEPNREEIMKIVGQSGAAAILAAVAAIGAMDAGAQAYPSKPVRIVVPFPPGGTSDILARTIGPALTREWGQPVIVDNRPGAAGNIAAEHVARSAGDGYTLFITTVGIHAIHPSLYSKLPFDAVRDFTPVTNLVMLPSVLTVHPSIPVRTVKELIALARKRPGELSYSSAGSGSQPHLTAELFKTMTGVDLLHVPYKGAAQQLTDLVAGHVALTFATAPSAVPYIKGGQMRAIGVSSGTRASALPDVPTISESVPGYEAVGWNGMVAPAGLPGPVLERIHATVVKVFNAPEVRNRMISLAADPVTTTPAEFGAYIKAEIAKWAKVVKASGARAE